MGCGAGTQVSSANFTLQERLRRAAALLQAQPQQVRGFLSGQELTQAETALSQFETLSLEELTLLQASGKLLSQ